MRAGSWLVVDDTYNANPTAVRLAIDSLMERALERGGRAVAVLGDMLELGPEADRYHREVGRYAAEAGVAVLAGYGPLSQAAVEGYADMCQTLREAPLGPETLVGLGKPACRLALALYDLDTDCHTLEQELRDGDTILVKASRGMRLERVVEYLISRSPANASERRNGAGGSA